MNARAVMGLLLVATTAPACVPASVIGPLQHERDVREKLLVRSRAAGVSDDLLNTVVPPLTPDELGAMQAESRSCRSSYLWKNGLTWTGSVFVAGAAGLTIGAALATGNNDANPKLVYGVSAGSLAALGSILVAVGGIVQQGFTDRGCWVK
jgi:hypothetical protein